MAKPIILSVDDDPQVLRSIVRDLRSRYGRDYRVLSAESGAQALEALEEIKSRGDHVALVLSDQRMPSMDGTTLLRESIPHFPRAKRALLTAYSDIDAAVTAINESDVDYYLMKPWDPPEEKLYPILDDMLQDWRAGFRPGFEGLKIVGDRWSALGHRLRDFLASNHIPYSFLDVESSEEARSMVSSEESGSLPVVVFSDGSRASRPSVAEVADKIGLQTKADRPFYDLVIVGAGPAGLATAVYAGSEGLEAILVEEKAPGGQAGTSSKIENYLGFPSGLSGSDLARRALTQTKRFGVEVLSPQSVKTLRIEGPYRHLDLIDGTTISCHSLMLATGVSWRMLAADGADRLQDQGVYYGAALTEAKAAQGRVVYTVGAGNSAGQAAMYFSEYASKVVMLVRGESLDAKMSQYLVDRIAATENIEVRLRTQIKSFQGEERLEALELEDLEKGETRIEEAERVFIFIGARPRTDWLEGQVACDDHGFVLTGTDLKEAHLNDWPLERQPFLLETSIPGIFAAGDVRHESVKRVASAVGEGSVSVHFVHRHLASL